MTVSERYRDQSMRAAIILTPRPRRKEPIFRFCVPSRFCWSCLSRRPSERRPRGYLGVASSSDFGIPDHEMIRGRGQISSLRAVLSRRARACAPAAYVTFQLPTLRASLLLLDRSGTTRQYRRQLRDDYLCGQHRLIAYGVKTVTSKALPSSTPFPHRRCRSRNIESTSYSGTAPVLPRTRRRGSSAACDS